MLMGFKWLCPACGHVNEYKGKKTTNVVVRCLVCKEDIKASSHIYGRESLPQLPKTTNELPRTTEYKSSMIHRPSKIQVPIDNVNWVLILKILDRGYSTIKNKPEVKAEKGGYYFDSLTWEAEIKKIEEIAKVMKLMGDANE